MNRRTFVGSLAALPLLPRFIPQQREHVVVVGAGAFGGWTALSLLRTGARVTLVDAWGAGNSRASSGGETRVIRAVYNGEPEYTRMVARALEWWREEEARWQQQVFFPVGALWMFQGDDAYARRSLEPMRREGLPLDEMTVANARKRWPQMNFGDVTSVFHEPRAGYLLARIACELVRRTFVQEGGEYKVAWVRPAHPARARLASISLDDGASLSADKFVFALGPWLGTHFPDAVGRRVVATRQEVFFFGTPAGDRRFDAGSVPAWVHMGERVVYGVPDNERRGMKVADDTAGDEVDPTTMERAPTAAGLASARAILRERFPLLANAPLVEARVCQYEASTDGHFLADRHPSLENVWLVGGGSGHGFKMGPAMGEHVAGLVQGRVAPHAFFAYQRLRPRPARPAR